MLIAAHMYVFALAFTHAKTYTQKSPVCTLLPVITATQIAATRLLSSSVREEGGRKGGREGGREEGCQKECIKGGNRGRATEERQCDCDCYIVCVSK